jgi:hypothetical protein
VSLWLTSSLLILHHRKIFAPLKNFQFEYYGWKTEKRILDLKTMILISFTGIDSLQQMSLNPTGNCPAFKKSCFQEITILIRGSSAVNDIPVLFRTDGSPILLMTEIPTFSKSASWPLIVTSIIITAVGAWLTVSPLAEVLGIVPLPPLYWLLLAIILVCYLVLTQLMKMLFYRIFGK